MRRSIARDRRQDTHTMFFGLVHFAVSACHSASDMHETGEVVGISFAGTPLKYFFFSR
jgi:hypothetical protein